MWRRCWNFNSRRCRKETRLSTPGSKKQKNFITLRLTVIGGGNYDSPLVHLSSIYKKKLDWAFGGGGDDK